MRNAFFASAPNPPSMMKLSRLALDSILSRYGERGGFDALGIAGPIHMAPLLGEDRNLIVYKEEHWNAAFHSAEPNFRNPKAVVTQCSGGQDTWLQRAVHDPN